MNDIIENIEHIWNERLNNCIKKPDIPRKKHLLLHLIKNTIPNALKRMLADGYM